MGCLRASCLFSTRPSGGSALRSTALSLTRVADFSFATEMTVKSAHFLPWVPGLSPTREQAHLSGGLFKTVGCVLRLRVPGHMSKRSALL